MKWYKRDPDAALVGMANLTMEECGAYNRLIDLLYSRNGDVPDDDAFCAMVFHCRPQVWRRLKSALIVKGKIHQTGGKLTANRVETTLKEAQNYAESQRFKAKKRWQSKADECHGGNALTTTTTTTSTIEEDKEERSLSVLEEKPTVRKRRGYPKEFEDFWNAYPETKNNSKQEAGKQWARLPEPDQQAAMAALPAFKAFLASKPEHGVVHACRFLSQRRFDGYAAQPDRSAELAELEERVRREIQERKAKANGSNRADTSNEPEFLPARSGIH